MNVVGILTTIVMPYMIIAKFIVIRTDVAKNLNLANETIALLHITKDAITINICRMSEMIK
jgi:hypothetical protein